MKLPWICPGCGRWVSERGRGLLPLDPCPQCAETQRYADGFLAVWGMAALVAAASLFGVVALVKSILKS